LLRLVLMGVLWRRPRSKREDLRASAQAAQADADRQREVQTVGQTNAEWYIYQGRAQGLMEGLIEGRAAGLVEALESTLLRLGRQRFGEPSEAASSALTALTDVKRLEKLTERLLQATSWQDLLDTP
jgi:hypothetical protein